MKLPDIDIDTPTTFEPEKIFPSIVKASRIQNNEIFKHPCGYYFQNIPIDKFTNLSAIPYEEATVLNYFKVDFLHLEIYDLFDNREQIKTFIEIEPDWDLLNRDENIEKLFQLKKHAKTVKIIKPRSIKQLADTIALIRPGKLMLIADYVNGKVTDSQLYDKSTDGYSFKKSHAIAYAHVIVLQLNLIKFGII